MREFITEVREEHGLPVLLVLTKDDRIVSKLMNPTPDQARALAPPRSAAEKRRALVTSRRKAAISASYAATSSAGGAKAKAYTKEPEVFLATAKPARTLRDVVDRVGQYLGVPQQLGAIVERVLAGAAEERRMWPS